MNRRLAVAVLWGILFGGLTFAAGRLMVVSDNAAIAAVQIVFTSPIIPGLYVAAIVGSLVPAAGINALINFALSYFLLRFIPGFKPNRRA